MNNSPLAQVEKAQAAINCDSPPMTDRIVLPPADQLRQPPGPPPIAIKRVPGTPLTPALSNAQLYAILNDQDLAQYQSVLQQSAAP